MDFVLTGGPVVDITQAEALLPDDPMGAVVVDTGYDAQAFLATVSARDAAAVIPLRNNRQQPRAYERHG